LDQFVSFKENPPSLSDPEIEAIIEKDRIDLAGSFCRSCGYCMPCPMGIEIPNCARMSQWIRRMPSAPYLTQEWQDKMKMIEQCVHCGQCMSKCPYNLDTPDLLRRNLDDYERILNGEVTL
jgi:predicted aldo/keto reductase-like oxidoreductase